MELSQITPTIVIKGIFIVLFILGSAFLTLFTWVSIGKTRLLNRLVKTTLAPLIFFVTLLFFILSVGTLVSTFALWITPLLFPTST